MNNFGWITTTEQQNEGGKTTGRGHFGDRGAIEVDPEDDRDAPWIGNWLLLYDFLFFSLSPDAKYLQLTFPVLVVMGDPD